MEGTQTRPPSSRILLALPIRTSLRTLHTIRRRWPTRLRSDEASKEYLETVVVFVCVCVFVVCLFLIAHSWSPVIAFFCAVPIPFSWVPSDSDSSLPFLFRQFVQPRGVSNHLMSDGSCGMYVFVLWCSVGVWLGTVLENLCEYLV